MSPLASLIVCTRDRPHQLDAALRTIAVSVPRECPIMLIDQSSSRETEAVVARHRDALPTLNYVRSATRGLSAARNEGVQRTTTDLVLFTDDDCAMVAGWVDAWTAAFASRPMVGIAFGPVVSAEPESPLGHIPTFQPAAHTHTHGLEIFKRGAGAVGMGASMALRRDAWAAVSGFDERLGAGTRYRSAEDTDIAFRIVRAGYRLGHADTPPMIHSGVRPWDRVVRDNHTGLGAMHAKHIRCGDLFAGELLFLETWRSTKTVLARALRGERPLKARSLQQYHLAVISSLEIPVDRATRLYRGEPVAC